MTIPFRRNATAGQFLTVALAATGILAVGTAAAQPTRLAGTTTPRLVGIQTAHRPGFDRVVFRFDGGLPARRSVGYVSRLIGDPSGKVVPIAGRAILRVVFSQPRPTTMRATSPSRAGSRSRCRT